MEWEDPAGSSKWVHIDEARERSPLECESIGLLIADTTKQVIVAGSYCFESDTVADVTNIPRSAVRKIVTIGRVRDKKKGKR